MSCIDTVTRSERLCWQAFLKVQLVGARRFQDNDNQKGVGQTYLCSVSEIRLRSRDANENAQRGAHLQEKTRAYQVIWHEFKTEEQNRGIDREWR